MAETSTQVDLRLFRHRSLALSHLGGLLGCFSWSFRAEDGTGTLPKEKISLLWRELNINPHEGERVLSRVQAEGDEVNLQDWAKMLAHVDELHVQAVFAAVHQDLDDIKPESMAEFFGQVQKIRPAPSLRQVQRLFWRLPSVQEPRLSLETLAQLLCSPGNSLADPAKRVLFQDMGQPLYAYYVDTSHNTYLEGNQLSSRSSVLRFVEVLRAGCRSVEVDVWDGSNGEPVVKHGYTVTTEVLFQDVIRAIADHAFVASEYPVIISIDQHCSAPQRLRQGEILTEVLGEQLLRPPWDEHLQRFDYTKSFHITPDSARRRFLVKSLICEGSLAYDSCVALPTRKLLQKLVEHGLGLNSSPAQESSWPWNVASGTAAKVQKLERCIGRVGMCSWTSSHLARAYPEGTRIGSDNVDPVPVWLAGVQMVALNYQTSDIGLLLNQGLFRDYNGSCGYVLKPPMVAKKPSKLWLCICCGHRLPRPDGSPIVSSPTVAVSLHPSGQVSQSQTVAEDGYHPVFNHDVLLEVSDSPLHILTFEASRPIRLSNARPTSVTTKLARIRTR